MADLSISVISDQASESNQAGWWHPLDSFQGAEYYGLCKDFGTPGKHQVEIVRRDADGTLTRGLCKNTDGTNAEYDNDVGHNQPSIVVDGEGYIHVFTSMHVNLLRYFRSTRPGDVSAMVDASWDFTDVDWPYTYPIVARGSNGDVYCMMRAGVRSSIGANKQGGVIYKYDLAGKVWSRFAPAAETQNRTVYPDDMSVHADGLHVIFQWAPYPAAAVRHVGEYGIIGNDGLMRTVNGLQVPMPVTQGQLAYKPLQPGENPGSGTGLAMGIQSAKFAFTSGVLSHIAYRFRTEDDPNGTYFSKFRVFVTTWNGSSWVEEEIAYVPPEVGDTSAALAATIQGGKRRVYFSVEYTAGGSKVAVIVLAEDTGTGWTYSILGNSAPTLLRLGCAQLDAGDALYVSSPYAGLVNRYFIPENYEPSSVFISFSELLGTLTGD
ncbi:TPA: BNR-4 repeat-containing protein [Klebsiella pneumoniae]|nr:BNR-4 repeat-containing protein [Klebsiella pneumoniae]HBR6758261.1 BNR-4 repeat-containing protein [Klebsiella pneumoniae]